MKAVGLIPARLESTRLPGKALKDICGLPAIVHTYKRSRMAKSLDEVYVTTDSTEIRDAVVNAGGRVIMTGPHRNGSERNNEAAGKIDCDVVINVQGDEILIDPDHIDAIVSPLLAPGSDVQFTMGVTPFEKTNSPSDFKVVLDLQGNLLYCSRSDIPYRLKDDGTPRSFLKAVFVVGFTKSSLQRFVSWDETPLELSEPNEFLRILEHGEKIRTVEVDNAHVSLDTAEDLETIRNIMETDTLRHRYPAD